MRHWAAVGQREDLILRSKLGCDLSDIGRLARPWLAVAASAALAVLLLGWIGARHERRIAPDAPGASLVYRDFSEPAADGSWRGGQDRVSTVVLGGLWPGRPAVLTLELSSRLPRPVRVLINAQRAARADVDAAPFRLALDAVPDESGLLRVQFDRGLRGPGGDRPSYLRVGRVTVAQLGAPHHPWSRLALFAVLGALTGAIALSLWHLRLAMLAALGGLLALTAGTAALPLQTSALWPWAAAVLLVVLAWILGGRGIARLPGFDTASAHWLVFGTLLRLLFALGFESADYGFHLHNVWRFRAGGVLTSVAPGATGRLPVPYPPLLYALLAPLPSTWDEWTVRIAIGVLEAIQPFLLYALVSAATRDRKKAATAAATLALMPEGILAIGKGIAANVLGSTMTLAVMTAIAARAHPLVAIGLLALGTLSHFGAAMTLVLLVAALGLAEARSGGVKALGLRWGAIAVAAGLALATYYREVLPLVWGAVTDMGRGSLEAGCGFGFHVVRLGKIIQDLVLKFGGWVFIVPFGWRELRAETSRMLRVWLFVGAGVGVLVVFTPVILRFEYFLLPAVAWAAALGSLELQERGRGWIATVLRVLCCVLQIALVLGLATGRFDVINAVMESPRWPLLGSHWSHAPGCDPSWPLTGR